MENVLLHISAVVLLGFVLNSVGVSAGLYAATYACSGGGNNNNCSAGLFTTAAVMDGWTHVADFATGIPPSVQSGMLASDPTGGKWWLIAACSGGGGGSSRTLYYYSTGASKVTRINLANDVTTLQYVPAADEFLATWQVGMVNRSLEFGAMDPYLGKQSTMIDLTKNASIPYASFGVSALNAATTAMIFVVATPSPALPPPPEKEGLEDELTNGEGGKNARNGRKKNDEATNSDVDDKGVVEYSLAKVAPTGDGISVEYGKASATLAIQSIVIVPGLLNPTPVALTMSPAAPHTDPAAVYTYSLVPWNITSGVAADGANVVGTWTSSIYNSFHATAAGGGAVYAAAGDVGGYAGRSNSNAIVIKVDLLTGTVTQLSMAGIVGAVHDLIYIQ